MSIAGAVAAPQLIDVSARLDDLEAGRAGALGALRPALHRVVVGDGFSGSVKTLLVQALLLLDDPRIANGSGGASLLGKIRKLVNAARDAHAEGGAPAAAPAAAEATRVEFSPDALLSPDIDQALVEEFVLESRAQLEIAESALLALDGDPGDGAAVDRLFRALHTIKGTSAFLGVEHATELTHLAESLLVRVRSGEATCTGELSNLIFRSIDMLDAMLVSIERAAEGEVAMLPDGFRPLLRILRNGPADSDAPGAGERGTGQGRRHRFPESTVRVRTADLDRLAGAVRELALTHVMLAADSALRSPANHELGRKLGHAERLAFELEEIATELQSVSLGATMQKLARLTRDVAYQSGKSVDLVTGGEEILIERTMAAALADPLLHMVRNAVDHGIEPADVRRAAGKPDTGRLQIVAERTGGLLVVRVQDDGRGLCADQLVKLAVARGLIAPDASLTEQQAFALIFEPGFSTASIVTELSGRGVGMDVVRTNVESVGGSIEIDSRAGHGTTFTIRLPFRSQQARGPQPSWMDSPRTIGLIA